MASMFSSSASAKSGILVIGGTGTIGKAVVHYLLKKNAKVRIFVTDQNRAKQLFGDSVEIHTGDVKKLETLRPALQGIEKVFLLTPSQPEQVMVERGIAIICRELGVKHIVKLSVYGADSDGGSNNLLTWHALAEYEVIVAGVPTTILRCNNFMSNLLRDDLSSIKSEGVIYKSAGDGRVSFIDPRDIGEAAAVVLTDPIENHHGCTYELTGPHSLSFSQVGDIVGYVTGRKVEYVALNDYDMYQYLLNKTVRPNVAKMFLQLYKCYRNGKAQGVTGDYKIITGREPRSYEQYISDHKNYF